jgi:hypothetical protein
LHPAAGGGFIHSHPSDNRSHPIAALNFSESARFGTFGELRSPLTADSLDEKLRLLLAVELARINLLSETSSTVQPQIFSTLPAMRTSPSFDRESFQKLLANVFAVQESQMGTQSLSAIVEVQQLINSASLDLGGAMHLIADRVRDVANATGVAIGLLRGDQLVYCAGSGSAASYIGRHVMAALSVSTAAKTSREILRVDNAETDARIEAAICRQFGAKSLLILLIYRDHAVAGVLEVFFSEAHRFQDGEVRSYQLMAGLVGEAMSQAQFDEQKPVAAELSTVPRAIHQITSFEFPGGARSVPQPSNARPIDRAGVAIMVLTAKWTRLWHRAGPIMDQIRSAFRQPRSYLALAGVVAAIVIACWIISADRRPVPSSAAPALQKPNAQDQEPVLVATPVPNIASKPGTIHRVRSGKNEVDYISDDVTVRHFTSSPTPQPVLAGYKQVDIGKDVTVRYFAPKTAVVPPTSGSRTAGHHKTRL